MVLKSQEQHLVFPREIEQQVLPKHVLPRALSRAEPALPARCAHRGFAGTGPSDEEVEAQLRERTSPMPSTGACAPVLSFAGVDYGRRCSRNQSRWAALETRKFSPT